MVVDGKRRVDNGGVDAANHRGVSHNVVEVTLELSCLFGFFPVGGKAQLTSASLEKEF